MRVVVREGGKMGRGGAETRSMNIVPGSSAAVVKRDQTTATV